MRRTVATGILVMAVLLAGCLGGGSRDVTPVSCPVSPDADLNRFYPNTLTPYADQEWKVGVVRDESYPRAEAKYGSYHVLGKDDDSYAQVMVFRWPDEPRVMDSYVSDEGTVAATLGQTYTISVKAQLQEADRPPIIEGPFNQTLSKRLLLEMPCVDESDISYIDGMAVSR